MFFSHNYKNRKMITFIIIKYNVYIGYIKQIKINNYYKEKKLLQFLFYYII